MKKKNRLVLKMLFFLPILAYAEDPLTLYNTTNQDVFFVPYLVPKWYGDTAQRLGKVYRLNQGKSVKVTRPTNPNILWYDRMMLVQDITGGYIFPDELSVEAISSYAGTYIGSWQGNNFYIVENLDGSLSMLNESTYKELTPYDQIKIGFDWLVDGVNWFLTGVYDLRNGIIATATDPIKRVIKDNHSAFIENPYKNIQASVRIGNTVSTNERQAIAARQVKVKKAFEEAFGPINRVPKIALVASGGGYRAMLCTLGFLTGAQRIGLLDMSIWIAALSGGVWGTMSYLTAAIESAMRGQKSNLDELRKELISRISGNGLESITSDEIKLLSDTWLVRAVTGQTMTLVDLYGDLVANQLLKQFGNKRFQTYLWQFANEFEHGNYPIPLLTTVGGEVAIPEVMNWYEFNPWEMRGPKTTRNQNEWHFAPTWSLGRIFNRGQSVDFELCKNLPFMYGSCGSAFAATIGQILDEIIGQVDIQVVAAIIRELNQYIGQKRLTWGEIYNFTQGMDTSPIKNNLVMQLVDGGLSFNLPYPVVSGEIVDRVPDILIFIDSSANMEQGATELVKTEEYARRNNLKFPKIDYVGINRKAVSIFKDETDPTVPVVIYFPRINEEGLWDKVKDQEEFKEFAGYVPGFDVASCVAHEACNTFNFRYTQDEAMRLSKLMEFNILTARDAIFDQIRQRTVAQ